MYEFDRELAKDHIADMHRSAEQRRLARLASCCAEAVQFFSRIKDRVTGKPAR